MNSLPSDASSPSSVARHVCRCSGVCWNVSCVLQKEVVTHYQSETSFQSSVAPQNQSSLTMLRWTTLRVVHFSGISQPPKLHGTRSSDSLQYTQKTLFFIMFHCNVPNVPLNVPKGPSVSICFYYNVPNVPNVPWFLMSSTCATPSVMPYHTTSTNFPDPQIFMEH